MNLKTCARYFLFVFFFTSLNVTPVYAYSDAYKSAPPFKYDWANNFICDVKRDYAHFYSTNNLLTFGNYFVAAGILANSRLDKAIRDFYQTNIRDNRTNSIFAPFNTIGSFTFQQLSIYFLAIGFGYWRDRSCAADIFYTWGYRSLRSFLVGTIPQVTLAKVLGAGRPIMHHPSKWQPFKYRMSVSGHAYWGATPFITAAMMVEQPIAKALLYGLSVMPGLARINFDAHYTSQVVLGWSIAYLSSRAVYNSDMECASNWRISVLPKEDGFLLAASMEF